MEGKRALYLLQAVLKEAVYQNLRARHAYKDTLYITNPYPINAKIKALSVRYKVLLLST